MSTPSLDDDDLTVVRWYECGRREHVTTGAKYVCPWDPTHFHPGAINRRRGSGRRIAAARWHLRRHLEQKDAA